MFVSAINRRKNFAQTCGRSSTTARRLTKTTVPSERLVIACVNFSKRNGTTFVLIIVEFGLILVERFSTGKSSERKKNCEIKIIISTSFNFVTL